MAKVTLIPPLRRNRINISSNLFIRKRAKFFFKRSQVQRPSPDADIENVLFEKSETRAMVRNQPRLRRAADDRQGQKRERLLVVVNAEPI